MNKEFISKSIKDLIRNLNTLDSLINNNAIKLNETLESLNSILNASQCFLYDIFNIKDFNSKIIKLNSKVAFKHNNNILIGIVKEIWLCNDIIKLSVENDNGIYYISSIDCVVI